MENLWKDEEANLFNGDLLSLRVYTSRLLGKEEDLVMHGGGNTSVKIRQKNIFGIDEDILYVKGSGWDLATIEAPGFAPVKLDVLHQLVELDQLSDMEMVKYQRIAMIDPLAPNPSVEAILHAIIPYTFVDHTHADAVVTITNTPEGREKIESCYGPNMLIIPYVMPGFILARTVYEMTRGIDWDNLDGIILMNHGVFTFDHDARRSYEKMIAVVSKAEDYLANHTHLPVYPMIMGAIDPLHIARIRKKVSDLWGKPVLSKLDHSSESLAFSNLPNINDISSRGPITPDHIIRTKRIPVVFSTEPEQDLEKFAAAYRTYFEQHHTGNQVMLDQAPRWAILPGSGTLSFGISVEDTQIIDDIARHTKRAIFLGEQLGGWKTLGQADLFEMEYWSLEQAKLKKAGSSKSMAGKVALVTGAASGIGKACTEQLVAAGAAVAALDIVPNIREMYAQKEVLGILCDLTNKHQVLSAIEQTIVQFGGIDMVVSNAGIFPISASIEAMDQNLWEKSLSVNLTSHQQLLQFCSPYLKIGFDPAVVVIGSKNVPAPGPGAAAYSVAKAGLTQLARVAAMEFGSHGIRVNVIHPNAVYDTGIWTEEVLQARARYYGLTVEAYKTNNLLKVEVTSKDVADLVVTMLGKTFSKTTGAQIPIDGGNERVI